jgi:hypothetical protein
MSDTKSPLARLVLFLVALSLFGGIVGGIASFVPALSPNATPVPPANSVYMDCVYGCLYQYPGSEHLQEYLACGQECYRQAMNRGG